MSGIIPKPVLENIRFANDIVDTIASYISIKKAGSAYKACCPFHKEKTPSFHVNPQRQIFHCFGCGAGGDVFGFVMQYENVDFFTAASMLADRAGIEIEISDSNESNNGPSKKTLYKIHSEVAELYRHCLLEMKESDQARQYIKNRNLPDDITEDFLIGYAPNDWRTLVQWAKKHKYSTEEMAAAGLILRKSDTDPKAQYYDRFRNRLMFPIRDEQSRVIGFSGRAIDKNDNSAKYVNSPESDIFHKSKVLYGMEKARRHIPEEREALICEGQIDVIRCHQFGFKTAIASQGTAFTDAHARIINRYADGVCIMFDSDLAGEDASIKTAGIFLDAGLAVRIARLPQGEDPDAFINTKGKDAFQQIIDTALSIVSFQIKILSSREKNAKGEVAIMRIAKAVLQTITRTPNAVQRATMVQEAAQLLNIPPTALLDDLKHTLKSQKTYNKKTATPTSDQPSKEQERLPKEERELCEHVVQLTDNPQIAPLIEQYLPQTMITHPLCRSIVKASFESLRTGESITDILLSYEDDPSQLAKFVASLLSAPQKITGTEFSRSDAIKDLILYIWRKNLEKERTSLNNSNPELRSQITYDLKALNRWDTGEPIIRIRLAE